MGRAWQEAWHSHTFPYAHCEPKSHATKFSPCAEMGLIYKAHVRRASDEACHSAAKICTSCSHKPDRSVHCNVRVCRKTLRNADMISAKQVKARSKRVTGTLYILICLKDLLWDRTISLLLALNFLNPDCTFKLSNE